MNNTGLAASFFFFFFPIREQNTFNNLQQKDDLNTSLAWDQYWAWDQNRKPSNRDVDSATDLAFSCLIKATEHLSWKTVIPIKVSF